MVNLPVSSAFVGRGAELSGLLDAQRDAVVHTVLVSGEAGIGKSRLLAEFTGRLPATTVVLLGRCPEFGNDGVPFAPFIAIMRGLLRRLGARRLAELLPARPVLARWLPELADGSDSETGEFDRLRLFGEILTLLESSTAAQPVVLILEDLHWADDSSRELLAFLAANLVAHEVLLVATYRPGAPALRRLLAEVARNPGVRTLTPGPLSQHEVGRQLAALLGREPERALVARVFARSAGNPLFVAALCSSPEDTPAQVSELLLAFRSGLSESALTALRIAAVAGSPVGHELLEAATELPERELNSALRELIDQRLLVAADTGYDFHHVLLKQALYADLLPVEQRRLHARLATLLRATPNLLAAERYSAELAEHARAGGELGLAVAASWDAATSAERAGAQSERLRHLKRVLDLWDKVPEAAEALAVERLDVLEAVVDSCIRGAAGDGGVAAAEEAIAAVDASADPRWAARLHCHRATLRNRDGQGGRDDLVRALELLPAEPPTPLRAEAQVELAGTLLFAGQPEDSARYAESALAVGEALAVPSLVARAHAYLGLAATDPAAAVRHFASAHAAADDPRTLLDVVAWESALLVSTGAYPEAIGAIQQGLRAAHETFRFAEHGPVLTVKWVQALNALGRWDEALDLVEETLAEPLAPLSAAVLRLNRAEIAMARGHLDAARADVDAAGELLRDSPWAGQYHLELGGARGRLALAADAVDDAAAILAETVAAESIARHPREAWALLALGVRIPGLSTLLADIATRLPCPTPVAAAYRSSYTAGLTDNSSDWADAVQRWSALRQPYQEAESLLGAAEAELAQGDRDAGRSALRQAAAVAATLGATTLVESARRLAARARLTLDTAPSAPPPPSFGLTPRELDVLRLVAAGSTNRRIAERLFISANTAGVHVSRILTKLGVASRTEAAAAAHRHGLLSD
ncbi:ATP-binding protein [Nocardia sp. NPDC050406]|uniref:ATP-binding protein n=1 Tax=Nocardia sp. NPDC050406 TaxID=3364318 RepID=UPI003798C4FF